MFLITFRPGRLIKVRGLMREIVESCDGIVTKVEDAKFGKRTYAVHEVADMTNIVIKEKEGFELLKSRQAVHIG
jgi:hypothetical protein